MGLRRSSIRLRIFLLVAIPILSLIGVYAFAATITASNAISLSQSRTVKNTIATPVGSVESALDSERLLAVVYLAAPAPPNLAALQAQEHKTDATVAGFKAAAARASGSASAAENQAFSKMLSELSGLPALRSDVTSMRLSRGAVFSAYGAMVDQDYNVLAQLILQADATVPLATQSSALARTSKVVDLMLQEDALVLGDTLARSFSPADRQQFTELVGARRVLYTQILGDFDPTVRGYYQKDVGPGVMGPLDALENKVIDTSHPGRVPPVNPLAWNASVQRVSAGLSRAATQSADELTAAAQPVADSIFLRLFLIGGLGLLGVLLSIFMSVWIGRGLVRQLADLRKSALDLAHVRLPDVVQRLRAGQDVDVSAEAPPLNSGPDEIGQVMAAFNAVQQTAVEAAVDEAKLRRGISDVFRNLARRSQSLLHRQLALLDTMERRASEPEELEDLYRIDHLTTRMRRHSEGLIILSGESPGRGWRHPVRIVDVLRAAVAEVEAYTRIRVTTATQAALIGPAVADVIHLIAELAENATIFSPPNAPVRIHGDIVGRGFAVEIEDRGLGITDEKLAKINHDLEHPPEFDLSGSEQLGLFVAGQLAQRHEIRITLQSSPYGGITAIVLIPASLIVQDVEAGAVAAAERAIRLTGRHGPVGQRVLAEPVPMAQIGAPSSSAGTPDAPAQAPDAPAPEPDRAALPQNGTAAALNGTSLSGGGAGDEPPPAPPPAPEPGGQPALPAAQAASVFTPRRPRPPTVRTASSAPFAPATPVASAGGAPADGSPPSGNPASAPDGADPRVTTTELTRMGLPVRVRQASLAPQLRERGPAGDGNAEKPGGTPSPEAARSTMTALQRGWERGRYISGAPVPSFDVAQDTQPDEESGESRTDE